LSFTPIGYVSQIVAGNTGAARANVASTRQQKLLSGSDDGRWTVDDGAIVYRLSSIVTRTSNEYPQGCTKMAVTDILCYNSCEG
jgi:hypothetical protein